MMTTTRVHGTPAPQGSKKAFAIKTGGQYTGRTSMVDDNAVRLAAWRSAVQAAWHDNGRPTHHGALDITIEFFLARPKGHYRTGRNAHLLRDTAPRRPAVKPDVDKLVRATFDGLTIAGAIEDDARIVDLTTSKHYADHGPTGARITIQEATR